MAEGQYISEKKLSCRNFSQKTNKRICFSDLKFDFKFQVFPSRQDRKTNLSVCFLGEVMDQQFCFEIYWPLSSSHFIVLTHSILLKMDSGVWYQEVEALKSSDIEIWILLILLLCSSWSEVMLSQVHSVWYILTKTNPYIRCCAA